MKIHDFFHSVTKLPKEKYIHNLCIYISKGEDELGLLYNWEKKKRWNKLTYNAQLIHKENYIVVEI